MMTRLPALLAACLLASAGVLHAAIYQSVDEQGNVVFSDEPSKDAQPVELPPLPTYEAPKFESAPTPTTGGKPATAGYQRLSIVSPSADETVRDNTGQVPVSVELTPDLNRAAGHRFKFFLDGKPVGSPVVAPETRLPNVDRGSHQVEVLVVDSTGKALIRSGTVRFYLHRHSSNFPTGPGRPAPAPRPPSR